MLENEYIVKIGMLILVIIIAPVIGGFLDGLDRKLTAKIGKPSSVRR